jgi:interferon-induced GTP-binding protein Mx1
MLSTDILEEKAKPWLQYLEELLKLGIEDNELPIPQIAVFGDQSSGKSSLLESISGIPFPKGTGLVTKCPTRISMSTASVSESWKANITLPNGRPISNDARQSIQKEVYTPEELSQLLSEAAAVISAASGNSFSSDSIVVTVSSPLTPNLTLVDLPGIIRTTTAGQNRSVIDDIDRLLGKYMSQPETIILAVIPANQDIATVDILERAHHHDPNGERTIGVLTKPDLVDQGTEEEILCIVNNIRKPLKMGYVMVKNRNQLELNRSSSLNESLDAEEQYFKAHHIWNRLQGDIRGTRALCDKLTQLIVKRAMDRGPYIKYHLQQKRKEIEQRLALLGTDLPKMESEKRKLLVKLISRFTQTLRQISIGDYRDSLPQTQVMFRLKFSVNATLQGLQRELRQNLPDFHGQIFAQKLSKDMVYAMRGRELPGFGSTRLLLSTVANELDTWKMSIEDCVQSLLSTYGEVSQALSHSLMSAFPYLLRHIQETLLANVSASNEILQRRVEEMFLHTIESASSDEELIDAINTIRFQRFDQALQEVLAIAKEQNGPGNSTKEELKQHVIEMLGHAYIQQHAMGYGPSLQLEEARAVLSSYWKLCEKKLHEDVAAAIDVVLLQRCSEKIEQDLNSQLQLWMADPISLSEVFSEDMKVVEDRQRLQQLKVDVDAALKTLDKLIPFCPVSSPSSVN